ncbi:uncharacterized protein LOC126316911 [Schistocerca gregaria]|uniref:uncharacterized protein LOC126316911 n=1 Tax=Schistocerca gregaria TaxID=7010 RepID=UPI00211DED12|nr:uncharacterized protein LOC126316911 [Schistocerca gregaria]
MTGENASVSGSSLAEDKGERGIRVIEETIVEQRTSSATRHSKKSGGCARGPERIVKSDEKNERKDGVAIVENRAKLSSNSQDSSYGVDEIDAELSASIEHEPDADTIAHTYSSGSESSDAEEATFFEEGEKPHSHGRESHRSVKKAEFLKDSVRSKIRREAVLSFDNVETAELDAGQFLMKIAERQKTIKLATCEQISFEGEETCFEELGDEPDQSTDDEDAHDGTDVISLEIEDDDGSCVQNNNGHVVSLNMSLDQNLISASCDCSVEPGAPSSGCVFESGGASIEGSRTKVATALLAQSTDDLTDNSGSLGSLSEGTRNSLCVSRLHEFSSKKRPSEGLLTNSQHSSAEHLSRANSFDSVADIVTASCAQGDTARSTEANEFRDKCSCSASKMCAGIDTSSSSEPFMLTTSSSKPRVGTKRHPTCPEAERFALDASNINLKDNSDIYSDDNFDQWLSEKKRRRILSDSIHRRKLSRSISFSRSDQKWQSISQLVKSTENHSSSPLPSRTPPFFCLQPSSSSTVFSESNRIHLSKLQASLKLSNSQKISSAILFQHAYDN